MPFISVGAIVWLACAVHVLRTGRPWYWFAVISMPVLGPLAYFLFEILPELRHDPNVHRATSQVLRKIDPERERRRIHERLQVADTPKNRFDLAEESLRMGDYQNASDLYSSCIGGVYADDPRMLQGYAQAQYELGDFARCRELLDHLIKKNPGYRSPSGHLLYARALEGLREDAAAASEYEAVVASFSGEEARVRQGLFLKSRGRDAEARKLFEESLARAKVAPSYYRRDQKEWLRQAEAELKLMNQPRAA